MQNWGGVGVPRAAGPRPAVATHNLVPQDLAPLFNSMKEVNTERRLWRETFLCSDLLCTSAVWMRPGGN